MRKFIRWIWSGRPNESLVGLILENRRLKKLAYLFAGVTMLVTLVTYVDIIYPAFQAPDMNNGAVRILVASKDYQEHVKPFFDKLQSYNLQRKNHAEKPSDDLYVYDQSQWGLVVTADLKLLKNDEGKVDVKDATRPQYETYRYESRYGVHISVPYLVLFCLVEIAMLVIMACVHLTRPSKQQADFEERLIAAHFADGDPGKEVAGEPTIATYFTILEKILVGFHEFCVPLGRRKRGRAGILVADEYDIQDILFPLLRLHFRDVQPEEPTPSFGGKSSQIDFLIPTHSVGVEVKHVRPNHKDADISDEIAADIPHYRGHPSCKHIVFFVYDPDTVLANPEGFRKSFNQSKDGLRVDVIVVPIR